jgi:hypothetical protein
MSVVIDIAAQFTGKRAFAQAENAADKLGRTVKHALIGVGVTAFAKSAITAFAQNEKQMQLFANSLRNIGFDFAIKDSKAFLNTLELQYGVVGEQLIPAYQQLLTTTRSLAATQNLTNIALDIAARQGVSVTQAADALSKAYLGNTKAVGALGLGISKATLASGDFAAIIKEIATITKGSAAQGADTLSGKMARLSIAAGKARESIGAGLVEALMQITKSQDIEQLQGKILAFGNSAAETLGKVGKLISDNILLIKTFAAALVLAFTVSKIASFIIALETIVKTVKTLRNALIASAVARNFLFSPLGAAVATAAMFAAIGLVTKGVEALSESATKATDNLLNLFGASKALGAGGDQGGAAKFAEGASQRAAKDAKKAAADQLKATKAQTKAVQDQAKLKKAQSLFDLDKVQILAALQGKLSEDEKLRLQLQFALLTDNAKEADRLSNQLAISQIKTTDLATAIAKLPPALNPFASFPQWIQDAINEINKLKFAVSTGPTTTPGSPVLPPAIISPSGAAYTPPAPINIPTMGVNPQTSLPGYRDYRAGERASINVTVQGNVISNKDLADTIRMQLLDSSASGSFSMSNRATRGD